MKKIIIYLLTISILFSNLNFSKAQVDPSDFLKVPVIDPKAVGLLTDILGLLKDELKRLNLSVLNIIQTQLQEMSKEIATDALKAQQYIEILAEEEKMLEGRKEKVNTLEEYEKALREARIVGAYLGLQNFIKSIGSCLNPRIRDELTSYIMNISTEFSLEQKAKELLDEVPDCPEETTGTMTLRPNFFTWLTQPFKLNLAQVSQNNQNEMPETIITSAFQETENSIKLSNLQNLGFTLIKEGARKKEEERKKQIGEIWSIELCKKGIVDKNIDGGNFICEEYEILIKGEDLKRFTGELALSQLNQPWHILNQALIKILTIDGSSTLGNKQAISEIIKEVCDSYEIEEEEWGETHNTCINTLTKQFEEAAQIQENEIKLYIEEIKEVKKKFEEAKDEAERLKEGLNNCLGAIHDLEQIIDWFESIIATFDELINELNKIITEFDPSYLYKYELIKFFVFNDLYELDLILQKLDVYERAIESGECSEETLLGNIALIKNQVIVVESKNKENKSFNFMVSLKNLFKPKLVEIKNEK